MVINAFKPAQVRVRVVMEGEGEDKPLTTGSVFLIPTEGAADFVDRPVAYQPKNGVYVIDDVPPGRYRAWFNNANNGYLKSVQSGERVLDSGLVDVGDGAVLSLLLTFSGNVATVSGDLQVSEDQAKQPVHVVLVSDEATASLERGNEWPTLDQSFHFSIPRVRPGKYLAFAVQEADYDLWKNADFVKLLQSEGKEVELHEKEQVTLHLKLITKEEIDDARKRLGL